LEASVGDEGANYSAGEKQLLALCRALVKNSRIIILVCLLTAYLDMEYSRSYRMRPPRTWTWRRTRNCRRLSRPSSPNQPCSVLLIGWSLVANTALPCSSVDRLNTIAYYDRILVMDAGEVAEYDVRSLPSPLGMRANPLQTPLNLFDNDTSIFRSLCNEAGLTRQDIERIRASVANLKSVTG
jgi:ATP-binding cassette subfamily C (CFTR/MRP) protein 1